MCKLQVLVATMGQTDLSLADTMRIQCSAVIANQTDRDMMENLHKPSGDIKMISTMTRGVGLNRNIALMAASAEYLLFADDDMVYYDGMPQAVCAAFEKNPDADVLVFGVDILQDGQITERRHLKPKRLRVWNAMRFGTYSIAIRRKSLLKGNITFSQLFGGGCPFSSGEDSLFLKTCFSRGLCVYSDSYVLGTCCKDTSSWFTGYHEKYFYDKGVLLRFLFPKMAYLAAFYFAFRFKRTTDLPALARLKLMWKGIRGGKALQPYEKTL